MSTGGIFQLITNDGKLDAMLSADKILKTRLANIEAVNRRSGRCKDPTPTLLDIERTHILFVNAHFKPFASCAYEYQLVKVGSGTSQLGSTVTFNIPQFGEFINDMVLHLKLSAPTLNQDAPPTPGEDEDYFRYHEYPGERLLKKVSFEVNGNPLDSYSRLANVMHRQFCLGVNKEVGYKRMMGQEIPLEGFVDQQATSVQNYREKRQICNGLQTPSESKTEQLEIFAPLHFWFSDPRIALASVAIPQGQRFVNVELAPSTDILSIVQRGVNTNSSLTIPTIDQCTLYVNNIFVTQEVHSIYIKRVGFNLIRVHREQSIKINTASNEYQLSQLKWPIETIYTGIRLVANENVADRWDKFNQVTDTAFTAHTDAVTAQVFSPLIDTLFVKAHAINLYQELPLKFFNSYLPYHKGAYNLNTPSDSGLACITFNLYPNSYQPSGHINVSRAREFYLGYSSSVIDSTDQGELYVLGQAINFLLIADGTAILRYTT